MTRATSWRRRLGRLASLTRTTTLPIVVMVGGVFLAVWVALERGFGDPALLLHLLYLPVVMTGFRFGAAAGAGAGVVAALLAGTLGGAASGAAIVTHGVVAALVGALVGAMSAAQQRQRAREQDIDRRERALSDQRVALVQLVSHELRTPLTVIRGSMETLRSRPEAIAPRFRGLIEATQRSAGRLEEMVSMMLAAADDLDDVLTRRTDVAVTPLIRHAAVSIDREIVERVRLDVPPDACVETVEAYLWLALRCLMDNAVRFSPDGAPIDVGFVRERDRAIFTMRDRGPGLPEGFAEAAFEPFTQADDTLRRTHNGLGMGLYTARRLARRLGGDVELCTEQSEGVTARIVLPQPLRRGEASGTIDMSERSRI